MRLGDIPCPDACGQAVFGVIGAGSHSSIVGKGSATTTGPKISSRTIAHLRFDIDEYRRLDEITFVAQLPAVRTTAVALALVPLRDSRTRDSIAPWKPAVPFPSTRHAGAEFESSWPRARRRRPLCRIYAFSTNNREPAQQHWPWLKKIALARAVDGGVQIGTPEIQCWAICHPIRG